MVGKTKSDLVREIIKCGQEPLHFINTYAKIQHPIKGLLPFKTYDYQNDTVRAFLDHRLNIILKARQLGFTTIVAAFITWFIIFNKDKNVLIISTKADVAKQTIRIIRNVFRYLPRDLMICKITTDNKQSIELSNGSRVKAVTTTADAGRSEAVSLLFIDEVAHIEKMDELWTGIWPTISCLVAGTKVLTDNGYKNIETFFPDNKKACDYFPCSGTVWGKYGLEPISHAYVSPPSKTYKITTHHGRELEVTENHPLFVLDNFGGNMKPAHQLSVGDYLRVDLGMNVWGNTILKSKQSIENTEIPSAIWTAPKKNVASFLSGYFDGDGVAIASKKLLQDIQLLLQNFGIVSIIYKSFGQLPQATKDSWRLKIDPGYSHIFQDEISPAIKQKQDVINIHQSKQCLDNDVSRFDDLFEHFYWDKISSIEESHAEVTYDFTVPSTHSFLQNGILGSNTGGRAILSSTPNGTANFFYRMYKQAQAYETSFNCRYGTYTNPSNPGEHYNDRFMWWAHPDHNDTWFASETAGKSTRDISQEYECSFNTSGDTFLPGLTLQSLDIGTTEPIERTHDDRNFWIWKYPEPKGIYIIPCDVSSGFAKDYSAFHVIRVDSKLEQVAEYKGKIPPDLLGELLMKISQIYNQATIAPENNSGWSGQAIQRITDANYPYLYWMSRKNNFVDLYNAASNSAAIPGYSVTNSNRIAMLSKMEQYIRKEDVKVNSSRLVDEFREFIWANGRPQAARSANDDLIMAFAGGIWIREESFMATYRNVDLTRALVAGMSTNSTPVSSLNSFNQSKNANKARPESAAGFILLDNGEKIDISKMLLSSG